MRARYGLNQIGTGWTKCGLTPEWRRFDFGVGKLYLAHYLSHGIIIVEGDAIAFFLI